MVRFVQVGVVLAALLLGAPITLGTPSQEGVVYPVSRFVIRYVNRGHPQHPDRKVDHIRPGINVTFGYTKDFVPMGHVPQFRTLSGLQTFGMQKSTPCSI